MSVARPATGLLFSRCLAAPPVTPGAASSGRAAPRASRHFSSSAPLEARRRPRFKSIRVADMGLRSPEDIETFSKDKFPEYSAEEKKVLRKAYSPEQMAALEAGEAAINPKDLTVQGRLRDDPYRLQYLDDFKNIQPIIDKRPKTKPAPNLRAKFMDSEQFTEDLMKWAEKFFPAGMETKTVKDFLPDDVKDLPEEEWHPRARAKDEKALEEYLLATDGTQEINLEEGGPTSVDILDYLLERSTLTDRGQGSNSALAPALPNQVPGVAGLYKHAVDPADEGLDDTGEYQDLKKQTGMTVRALKSFTVKTLVLRFVSNQTRLGKIRSASVMALAGNKDGWLGLGVSKSTEVAVAMQKAKLAAIRDMQPIRRYEGRTIYGNVEAKVSGTVVRLSARPPGKNILPKKRPYISQSSSMCLTRLFRIWPPRTPPDIRNVPCGRHSGSRGQDPPVAEPHELGQGDLPGPSQPAGPGRDRDGARQEACGREEGVLWRRCILIPCIIVYHLQYRLRDMPM